MLSLSNPKLDNLANEIWKSAERLRGKFKAYEYQNVILPIIVVRRLECELIQWRSKMREEVLGKRPELKEKASELGKLVKKLEISQAHFSNTTRHTEVGKAAIFRKSKDDAITFASYLVRLRLNHQVLPEFFNYVVNSRGFLGFARRLAIPSVQQSNLNSTRYGRLWVPLPPLDEQGRIVDALNDLSRKVRTTEAALQKQIDTLIAYRKSLIHECVTGQRRIAEADLARVGARLPEAEACA